MVPYAYLARKEVSHDEKMGISDSIQPLTKMLQINK